MRNLIAIAMVLLCVNTARCAGLHAVKPEPTIKLSVWLKARISKDLSTIAKDRAKLRAIAGKDGVRAERASLLRGIISCRREIAFCKRGVMPHFTGNAKLGGGIFYLRISFHVVQVLSPHSALCNFSIGEPPQAGVSTSDGEVVSDPPYIPHYSPLYMVDGFNFSGTVNRDYVPYKHLVQYGKAVTYKTAMGATNTVRELHPVKFVDDLKKKRKLP